MQWLERLMEKLLALLPQVYIIEPTERGAKVFGGKKYKIIGPGWYLIWPVIHRVIRMDVVTQVLDLLPQTVRTSDGHEIVVSGIIRYHINDIEKALFAVQDVDKALSTMALGVILEYVQSKSLPECMNVEGMKKELRRGVADAASGWGVKIEQVALTDLGRVTSLRLFGDRGMIQNGC